MVGPHIPVPGEGPPDGLERFSPPEQHVVLRSPPRERQDPWPLRPGRRNWWLISWWQRVYTRLKTLRWLLLAHRRVVEKIQGGVRAMRWSRVMFIPRWMTLSGLAARYSSSFAVPRCVPCLSESGFWILGSHQPRERTSWDVVDTRPSSVARPWT